MIGRGLPSRHLSFWMIVRKPSAPARRPSSICQCHRWLAHQQPDSLTPLRGLLRLLVHTFSTSHTSRTPPADAS